jgi:DGQHR domain-containing protein
VKRSVYLSVPALSIAQPIGTFYAIALRSSQLAEIAYADVRHLDTSTTEVEQYLGIQRKLDEGRLTEIEQYVKTVDASFPTSIVIAVGDERSMSFDATASRLTFYDVLEDDDGPAVSHREIARILDGQHRLAGLAKAGRDFDLAITVFPAIDIADQAYIFATVNLAQTKVNRSLVFDLSEYSRSRSPEKSCHYVAVALNRAEGSPFYKLIKRLGSATPGVAGETLTQATFVQSLLPYISRNWRRDRDDLRRGHIIHRANANDFQVTPFRNLFLAERDDVIADIIWNYFDSVRRRWPVAWESSERGAMIKRTNGFRAFMNALRRAYLALGGNDLRQPGREDFARIWERSTLTDSDFFVDRFHPGTSGERALTRELESAIAIFRTNPRLTSAR